MAIPLYRQVADDLRRQIEDGSFRPGDRLPTESAIRDKYHISRNTARDAVKILVTYGLVESRPGRGIFVAEKVDPFVTVATPTSVTWQATSGSDPVYRQVAEDLRIRIESHELAPGEQLPTDIEIREYYDVSRNVAHDAVKLLSTFGLVETRPGRGTFVVGHVPHARDTQAKTILLRLRSVQFSTTRLRPGYDEQEVDAFLEEVAAEVERVIQDTDELRTALAEGPRTGREPVLSVTARPRASSLTPGDIRNKMFSTTRLRPGYDEEEVDAFLEEVEAELGRLINEREDLRDKFQETLRALEAGPQSDGWETEARALASSGRYQDAEELLATVAATDPAQARRIRIELGFISMPDADRRVIAEVWKATVAGKAIVPEPAVPPPVTVQQPRTRSPHRSPQQSGATLEQATVDLFTRLFAVDLEETGLLLSSLRRQAAGTQFGHDIELECGVTGNPSVRCHVECKNLDRPVTLADIAAKLTQQKFYHRDAQVDHWVLISPHHDVANEVRAMLSTWEQTGEYPFSVQVWSPENRIRELFALEPAVYQAVYGQRPSDGELNAATDQAVEIFRARLAPQLRVDKIWRRYLEDPRALCFVNEDFRHFEALFGNHLALQGADERGALLDGSLMDQVDSWVGDGKASPLLLLADFGEGKSVFTYCLARRLCEEFMASPDGRVFPLRIPLREYKDAGSGRGLLQRRLREIGADVADWRRLTSQVPTLAILDGFDEISTDLSPATITANLRGVEACLTELSGSKVLVTSRQRILDSLRDWERTLDRLQRPRILRIASSSRRQRVQYLEQFATDNASARVLANLRGLYDPIGLAAKPLFLQMIRETLTELPDDSFSELIMYDTYITKSLRHKIEFLEDEDLSLTRDELIANIRELLEDIAVQLQEANLQYIYLRDYQGTNGEKIAALLWKMRDQPVSREQYAQSVEDDATNRVGIRSLLKAVPAPNSERWPADFFHRSMREYFVAQAIVRRLSASPDRARQILSAAPLMPEITHFAAKILRESPDPGALASLESFTRSATIAMDTAYLGGNAITLLYAARGDLPAVDWSGLRLDHAQLQGADLRAARFAGASLRYANLDNANLENADLTGADLEGVQLDETSQVLAVTAVGSDQIIAAYEDKSLREWHSRPGAGWESRVIAVLDHRVDRLQLTPQGRIVASGDGVLSVLEGTGHDLRCRFRTNSRFRATVLGANSTLVAEEIQGGVTRLAWLDTNSAYVLDTLEIDAAITSCTQLDGKLYAYATFDAVHVITLSQDMKRNVHMVANHGISCIDLRTNAEDVLVAAGHHDGTVSVNRIDTANQAEAPTMLWRRQLHDGPVTSVVLNADDQVITGSTDRTVCVTPLDDTRPRAAQLLARRLHLTLRCKNVRFAGVRTEQEQAKLRQYSAS